MIPCFNKQLFGIDCPGCGLQRAFALLCQGRFREAFFMYPAIYTLVLLAMFLVVTVFYPFKYDGKIKTVLVILNVLIIIISYIIKMNSHL